MQLVGEGPETLGARARERWRRARATGDAALREACIDDATRALALLADDPEASRWEVAAMGKIADEALRASGRLADLALVLEHARDAMDAGARHAERVAERDRAAKRVDPRGPVAPAAEADRRDPFAGVALRRALVLIELERPWPEVVAALDELRERIARRREQVATLDEDDRAHLEALAVEVDRLAAEAHAGGLSSRVVLERLRALPDPFRVLDPAGL